MKTTTHLTVPLALFSLAALQGIVPRSAVRYIPRHCRVCEQSADFGRDRSRQGGACQGRRVTTREGRRRASEATDPRGRPPAARPGPRGEARAQLQQQEQSERTNLERAVAQMQTDLQQLQRQVSGEMQGKVKAALDDLVKGKDVLMVVQSENVVVWAAPALDMTSEVIERLNAGDPPVGR